MNLIEGRPVSALPQNYLETLRRRTEATLASPRLPAEVAVEACAKLLGSVEDGAILPALSSLGVPQALAARYLSDARRLFSAEALHSRIEHELGSAKERAQQRPLGVLLHVMAGNADGLPAFSVLEGLVTGNINIVKLPSGDGGLSVGLLEALIKIEPRLASYVYVLEISSKDTEDLAALAGMADGVAVWGGDGAVEAFRKIVRPNVRLIEWGHKLSFGYVVPKAVSHEGLRGFAKNIAETGQLLCSSCQGLFVDTEDTGEVLALCRAFLPLLQSEVDSLSPSRGVDLRALCALAAYTERLDGLFSGSKIFEGDCVSVTAFEDGLLRPALHQYGPWVRPLPRGRLLETLRPHKNHLQTVGLLCAPEERDGLAELFFACGATTVCPGGDMSRPALLAAHDGELSLRRYVRVVNLPPSLPE